MSVKLTVLSDQLRGTSFVLSNQEYVLGRSDSADITIAEGTVSGRHCVLFQTENGGYAVKDEGSTNGTRVNGRKLEDEAISLENGDLLQVGSVEMMFENTSDTASQPEKTVSVISLDEPPNATDSVTAIKNLSSLNKNGGALKKRVQLRTNKKHNLIFYSILGLLGLIVVVMLLLFILKTVGK